MQILKKQVTSDARFASSKVIQKQLSGGTTQRRAIAAAIYGCTTSLNLRHGLKELSNNRLALFSRVGKGKECRALV